MKSLLETLGFVHLWENKTTFFLRRTMTSLKSKLSERYTSYFKSVINEETKTSCKKENYLSLPLDKQSLFSFSRQNCSMFSLAFVAG